MESVAHQRVSSHRLAWSPWNRALQRSHSMVPTLLGSVHGGGKTCSHQQHCNAARRDGMLRSCESHVSRAGTAHELRTPCADSASWRKRAADLQATERTCIHKPATRRREQGDTRRAEEGADHRGLALNLQSEPCKAHHGHRDKHEHRDDNCESNTSKNSVGEQR